MTNLEKIRERAQAQTEPNKINLATESILVLVAAYPSASFFLCFFCVLGFRLLLFFLLPWWWWSEPEESESEPEEEDEDDSVDDSEDDQSQSFFFCSFDDLTLEPFIGGFGGVRVGGFEVPFATGSEVGIV